VTRLAIGARASRSESDSLNDVQAGSRCGRIREAWTPLSMPHLCLSAGATAIDNDLGKRGARNRSI
jgi:hypothetical protein